jgi:type IV secretion system protein TrbL
MRFTRRHLLTAGILLGLLLSLWGPAPAAHAEPTDTEKTQAATAAAQSVCGGVGSVPFVGDKAVQMCTEAMVMILTDPTKATAEGACKAELTAIGLASFGQVQQACVQVVQPLVAGAAAMMAQKLQQLSDAVHCVESTAQGDVFACQTQLVQQWIGKGVQLVWSGVVGVVLAPTQATNIIDLRANPNAAPQAAAFRSLYGDIGWIAAGLVQLFMLLALIQAIIQGRIRTLVEAVVGVFTWGIFWIAGMTVAVLILSTTDSLTLFLAGENGSKMQLTGIDKWLGVVTKVSGGVNPTFGDVGSSVGVFFALVLLVAMIVIFVTLALREVSILLMAVVLPVLLAMQAGPGGMRKALPTVAKAFITIALAKPLMVIGLRLGASFVSVPADGKVNLWSAVLGLVVLGISAYAPGVLYKLFGVMEGAAGQRMGGASHGIDAAGRSAVDMGDSARSVFASNAPSTPVAASGGGAATGGARVAASSGGGAAAAGSVAGPIGLVLGAATMAASTATSVGSMVASQVGTGGGALGDAEHAQPGAFPRSYGGLPPQAAAPSAAPSMPTPPPPPTPTAQP